MNTSTAELYCRAARLIALALVTSAVAHAQVFGPRTTTEIRIVVDVTADGRKLPPPSAERPIVYFPVTADIEVGADAPGRKEVHGWLARTLAARGYIPVNPHYDRPSQLLVFEWGEIDPQIEDIDGRTDEENPILGQKFWNESELLDLVGGKRASGPMPWWKRENLRREGVAGRHFVRLVAFDYEAAKKKKRKLLWHARVSTHSDGVTLKDVLATLIKAGGPHFGRATKQPVVVTLPFVRDGRVELGEPTVKEYLPSIRNEPEAKKGR